MPPFPLDSAAGTATGDIRTGFDPESLYLSFLDNLYFHQARGLRVATLNDCYMALAYTVRDRLLARWIRGFDAFLDREAKVVAYLSAEFLTGPHLGNNLVNLGILEAARVAVARCGLDLDALIAQEEEPGLGNGGLGRLAACYMDSLATLAVPAIGYGIRYEYGIFDQEIRDGRQVEITDKWLQWGNPWEIERPDLACRIGFGGRTEAGRDAAGRFRVRWIPDRIVRGIPCDTAVSGYQSEICNLLRLWRAEAVESFDFQTFNQGDYYGAVEQKLHSENLTKVLYPNDEPLQGKQLRLEQQYFFTSCALQDMMRLHLRMHGRPENFDASFAVQLNDTHPSVAVAELMRLLVDEHELGWETAWATTVRTFGYTNHTLLPEALETWPLPLFGRLLPRHLEIIFEINRRFLDDFAHRFPGDAARLARVSLIDEAGERRVRMAHLATVGSHAVNGVAKLHTELLKASVLRDFAELFPERFSNQTNGVTPRRWLALANPGLAALVGGAIGDGWIRDLDRLRDLEAFADDAGFRDTWRRVKVANKRRLADAIRRRVETVVDPDTLFDVQVKRIHEYKRQHLNVLGILTQYLRIRRDPGIELPARTFVFGGKAAPGYTLAKLMIRLVTATADLVNGDAAVGDRLKIVFFPDFNVTNGQIIYPAADLSEQISTAGTEASGTGNMKLALNGALTIGTLDGATIEIRNEVGAENLFIFGHDAAGIAALAAGGYDPRAVAAADPELAEVLGLIGSDALSPGEPGLFQPLLDALLDRDRFFVLADYRAYVECQDAVSRTWGDTEDWTRRSILTVARMGYFSSDRAVRGYSRDIWHVAQISLDAVPSRG